MATDIQTLEAPNTTAKGFALTSAFWMMVATFYGLLGATELVAPDLTANMGGIREGLVADFSARLKKIKAPILVVWGRQDGILPVSEGEAAVERVDNVRLHVMDQAGHLPQIDKPEEFNATVLDFLKD